MTLAKVRSFVLALHARLENLQSSDAQGRRYAHVMYELDPERLELAEEFKARPYGEHSPDLQYLLNLMRRPGAEPFHVLVMTAAGERWTLALMPPGAKGPPQLTNTVFTSLEAAEWHVFKLRWQALSGQELPID